MFSIFVSLKAKIKDIKKDNFLVKFLAEIDGWFENYTYLCIRNQLLKTQIIICYFTKMFSKTDNFLKQHKGKVSQNR